MAGIFDLSAGSSPQYGLLGDGGMSPTDAGLLSLFASMVKGDLSGGINAYAQANGPDAQMKRQMGQLQMQAAQQGLQKGGMEMSEMQRKLADDDAARKLLQGIYAQRGMPQSPVSGLSPAQPGLDGQPAAPSAPSGQFGMPSTGNGVTPKAEVWQQYKNVGDQLAAQGLVGKAQEYWGLAEKMRPKYSTTPQIVRGPDGKLINVLIAEDGTVQQMPYGVKPDMTLENLGGSVRAIDKNALSGNEAFARTQSPDSIASNAVAMRGQNMTDARSREANANGKLPAGYRLAADGVSLEFIPGGPADPNAAKRAAPTEFQGKSATFGARALEADKILSGLDGNYSPAAVNTKEALAKVPLVGGALEAAGNLALSDSSQKAEQAQRNFVNAVLRQESGAAISAGEFENAKKQYFPQPGDSEAVKAQKAQNRQTAIRGFQANSRPGSMEEIVSGTPSAAPGAAKPSATMRWNPRTQKVEMVN